MHRHIGLYALLLIAMVLPASCGNSHGESDMSDDDLLVRVGNSVLSRRDVVARMPLGLSPEDSARFVRGYVRAWIDKKLIGEVALKNIPDSKAVEKMVEDYRTELILWEYRRMMFEQRAPSFLHEDSLKAYFESHPGSWISESPLMKGILVKVPESDPKLKDIRNWYKSAKTSDLENLEKYAFSDTTDYDYFRDRWVSWDALKSRVPVSDGFSPDSYWKTHNKLEVNHGGYVYLLSVSEFLPSKSPMPYEVAVDDVKERLSNERRKIYDRELRDALFEEGLKSGELELNIRLD